MKHVDDQILNEAALSYQVVKHRTDKAQKAIDQAKEGTDRLVYEINQLSGELDELLSQADTLLDGDLDFSDEDIANADSILKQIEDEYRPQFKYEYEKLEILDADGSWENLLNKVRDYADKNKIYLSKDPFDGLLTQTEKERIVAKIIADYKVNIDLEERESALESYLSYAMLFVAIRMGRTSEYADELNNLCDIASDLLHQYVSINPKYNHKDYLDKPRTLNEWFLYFNKYYPELFKGSFMPSYASEKTDESTGRMEDALHEMGKRPTWVGMIFSIIYQFTREEVTCLDKNLFIENESGTHELIGKNTCCKLIAGFVNWLDALCGSTYEPNKDTGDSADIRNLVLAVLEKCGFGESDQEGVVKTIQDFSLDIYNNLVAEENQIDGKTLELSVCDYIMQFIGAVQKRAEGVPFAQAAVVAEDAFVRRCQVVGYGLLAILKKSSTAIGKADVWRPLLRLVNSVDVDGWADLTYQSLMRARTVYLGYYINLEKMDADLEEEWKELFDNGISVSNKQY